MGERRETANQGKARRIKVLLSLIESDARKEIEVAKTQSVDFEVFFSGVKGLPIDRLFVEMEFQEGVSRRTFDQYVECLTVREDITKTSSGNLVLSRSRIVEEWNREPNPLNYLSPRRRL